MVRHMDEEEMLKRMTKLLEQGCTMLATHHDCGAPLFRCKGEIICPACSMEASSLVGGNASAAGVKAISPLEETTGREVQAEELGAIPPISQIGKAEAPDQDELARAKGLLRRTLLHRLKDLTEGMENEGDLDKLHRQLDCIERIVNILEALER